MSRRLAGALGLVCLLLASPLSRAPALASGHVWRGTAGGIAGRGTYSRGEWIYTGFAFDDHGAAAHPFVPDYEDSVYPGDTSARTSYGTYVYPAATQTPEGGYDVVDSGYRYNAANLVELRMGLDTANVYFRVGFNYLAGPDKTVAGIGIDTDRNAATGGADWPFGGGLHQQNGYEYFLTAYGTGGYLTSYTTDGTATNRSFRDLGITIREDLRAYTYDISVPRSVLDPAARTWRFYGGAGLWDAANNSWLQVQPGVPTPSTPGGGAPGLPNVFDLAFHGGGPVYPTSTNGSDFNYWDDEQQALDLAASDISKDHADVDFGLLRSGYSSGPADLHGTYERTYRSRFNFGAGLLRESRRPDDDYDYQSPVQPYEVYVPSTYNRSRPAPLWVLEHYRGGNYRSYTLSAPGFRRVADALGAIVVIPNGRGQYRMCESDAEADFFEVLADVGRHYSIDRSRVYLGGMSMGGFCTWRLGLLYPDLFAAAIVYSGWPYSAWPAYGAAGAGPLPPARYDMTAEAANATALPIQVIHGSNDEILPFPDSMGMISALDAAGAELNVNVYLGRHHDSTFPGVAWEAGINWLRGRVLDSSPPVVNYTIDPLTANPDPANGAPADYMQVAGWCNAPPFSGSLGRTFQPGLAFVYDRAYWLTGLKVADCGHSANVRATSGALANRDTSGSAYGFTPDQDSLGPYLNEGDSLRAAPRALEPRMNVSTANLRAATVDLVGAGFTSRKVGALGGRLTVHVTNDSMLALSLIIPPGLRMAGGGPPVVALPPGTHDLVLSTGKGSANQAATQKGGAGGSVMSATGGDHSQAGAALAATGASAPLLPVLLALMAALMIGSGGWLLRRRSSPASGSGSVESRLT